MVDMFFHAYHSYMVSRCGCVSTLCHMHSFLSQDHAYPADELMPLTCKGRVRGHDKSRGDIDDALGM